MTDRSDYGVSTPRTGPFVPLISLKLLGLSKGVGENG